MNEALKEQIRKERTAGLAAVKRLQDENSRLRKNVEAYRQWIAEEGERTNTCVFNVLGETCLGCQCERKPSNM